MKAYKRVRKKGDIFYSCGAGLRPRRDALCLEYREGEITIAHSGTVGIFLFENSNDLKIYSQIGEFIMEVETLSKILPVRKLINKINLLRDELFYQKVYNNNLLNINTIEEYTQYTDCLLEGEPFPFCDYYLPKNTILCKKVKVTRLFLTNDELQNSLQK